MLTVNIIWGCFEATSKLKLVIVNIVAWSSSLCCIILALDQYAMSAILRLECLIPYPFIITPQCVHIPVLAKVLIALCKLFTASDVNN